MASTKRKKFSKLFFSINPKFNIRQGVKRRRLMLELR